MPTSIATISQQVCGLIKALATTSLARSQSDAMCSTISRSETTPTAATIALVRKCAKYPPIVDLIHLSPSCSMGFHLHSHCVAHQPPLPSLCIRRCLLRIIFPTRGSWPYPCIHPTTLLHMGCPLNPTTLKGFQ